MGVGFLVLIIAVLVTIKEAKKELDIILQKSDEIIKQ